MARLSAGTVKVSAASKSFGIPVQLLPNMGKVPMFFYLLLMDYNDADKGKGGRTMPRDFVLTSSSPDFVESIIPYIQDPQLKRSLYNELRRKMIGNQYTRSIIINEAVNVYKTIRSTVKYFYFTAMMHLDK